VKAVPAASEQPTVFTVCGLPGSGKTTLAKRIAKERSALCLSADTWVLRLYGPDLPVAEFPRYRERVWELCWDVTRRLIALGVSVVLDFSFYRRAEREEFRRRTEALGARFRMFYLECSDDVLQARLRRRNRRHRNDVFPIAPEELAALAATFELPTPDEDPEVVRVEAEVDLALTR
jgi:predicted kinase